MSCYICGRSNCAPCFHSLEEQERYSEVEEAYQRYLDTLERVRQEIEANDED